MHREGPTTRSHWRRGQSRSLNYRIECRLAFKAIGALMAIATAASSAPYPVLRRSATAMFQSCRGTASSSSLSAFRKATVPIASPL